ncbi:MAG: glutamate synthase large subunit [Saprospiraceae bacterium]|nr:glutamate synthase large subunit [Saprospiraceae bacterium]
MLSSDQGLYTPSLEKDSCGTGMIVRMDGTRSHALVRDALLMLSNMEHRGACGCEANTGDGAGIMVQIPDAFLRASVAFELPEAGAYGLGMLFLPLDEAIRDAIKALIVKVVEDLGFVVLGYRSVPVLDGSLGDSARATQPVMEQLFVRMRESASEEELERRLFVMAHQLTHAVLRALPDAGGDFYLASLSSRTVVYKGMLTTYQLPVYFPDLSDERFTSSFALIHSRFSTNTTPRWSLAQPFRMLAHNGEINTVTGNLNWWKSREKGLQPGVFTAEEWAGVLPVCRDGQSDSAYFDNVLEALVRGGFSLPHALMMMIPEAWENDPELPAYKQSFYAYHKTMMEPWDGPASLVFTDGRKYVGAMLDRNGLRPSRYCLMDDNTLIVASEAGALPVDQSRVIEKGRLQSGKMLLVDLEAKRLIQDGELKEEICRAHPYQEWLDKGRIALDVLPLPAAEAETNPLPLSTRQQLFGYSREDLKYIIEPMAQEGQEPVGSMGLDVPLAVLSEKPQHLANYFRQLFAQVTNPPIDPIREASFMSLHAMLGHAGQVFDLHADRTRFIHLEGPVLDDKGYRKVLGIRHPDFQTAMIDICYPVGEGAVGLESALTRICAQAATLAASGSNILVLSDQSAGMGQVPIPSLMAVGAIHHHLVREQLRGNCSLLVAAGDCWEIHHFAALVSFGASAIFPHLVCEMLGTPEKIYKYTKSVEKGLLKVMSKIGISTLQSYQGAQTFEILGLHQEVVARCFTGAVSRIGGLGFEGIGREMLSRYAQAFPEGRAGEGSLQPGGIYQWKKEGEQHLLTPRAIHHLQVATRANDRVAYDKYAAEVNANNQKAMTLRGLLDFKPGERIPLELVEPAEAIMKRFSTGAMSFGSISHEAHTTLAIAMNRIGAKSNSGEGGEDPERYVLRPDGSSQRSAIKQVASGRFGVTIDYLASADEIQIKMAQGAKPGEGGQLPAHKVDEWIGRVRHATPGVGLISPPPHHDIYSIEDLAQLIFDLKNANPSARISVKLVSKAGVGIIASGVAKAHADVIMISGHDGGTGASPLSSIRHAGLPWELGLAESHQTLLRNDLRKRVVLQTDGQLRTGRDIAIATLLGAEEWSVATAALVVEGCILMRKCHLNTCPVGIATQDPELRKRFNADPDYVVNFFRFLAEDLRQIMADLGFRTIEEMVGRTDKLALPPQTANWKYQNLDLSALLYRDPSLEGRITYKSEAQDHGIDEVLDRKLIERLDVALSTGSKVEGVFTIKNTDRATGTMLSHELTKRYGAAGLPDASIACRFRGSAGQSFGAFAAPGIQFTLEGEANDYVGKGLSGGRLIVVPDRDAVFEPSRNIIIGNVAFYGATSGEAYLRGKAGERFCVRNSGAKVVVEGVGDHACEYMTGGVVVILGDTGKNFGAGMSGGIAYVYDPEQQFVQKLNTAMVAAEQPHDKDLLILLRMIRNHFAYTGSKKALAVIENWDQERFAFVKVMPADLKRVLQARKTGFEIAIHTAIIK